MPDVHIVGRPEELARHAAQHAIAVLTESVERHGRALWVLAGGSSPLAAYRHLVAEALVSTLDWSRVSVVVGDERLVPLDHADSNWGQIRAILAAGQLDEIRAIVPPTNLPLRYAARRFEADLRGATAGGTPARLDLVWLGVGEDGHTMSLFPGDSTLQDDTGRLILPVSHSPKPPPQRLTLSPYALEGARCVVVFGHGESKRAVVQDAIRTGSKPIGLATHRARAAGAEVRWLLDTAVAAGTAR